MCNSIHIAGNQGKYTPINSTDQGEQFYAAITVVNCDSKYFCTMGIYMYASDQSLEYNNEMEIMCLPPCENKDKAVKDSLRTLSVKILRDKLHEKYAPAFTKRESVLRDELNQKHNVAVDNKENVLSGKENIETPKSTKLLGLKENIKVYKLTKLKILQDTIDKKYSIVSSTKENLLGIT